MAEEGSVYELEGLEKQLQSLLSRYSSDELRADSKTFCSDYCKVRNRKLKLVTGLLSKIGADSPPPEHGYR